MSASEENTEDYTDILIAVAPLVGNRDPDLENFISEALQLEFGRLGLAVTAVTDIPQMDDRLSWEDLLPMARNEGFDIVGTCSYREADTGVRIELEGGSVRNPEISTMVSKTTTVNLSLDTIFTEAVVELIGRLEEMIPGKNFDPQRQRGRSAAAEVPRSETPPPQVDDSQDAKETVAVQETARDLRFAERTGRFYLSIGSAPFLALGKTNLYFSLGSLSSIHGNYNFQTSIMDIGVGLYVGVNYFQAGGLLVPASNNFLLPIGVDIHLSSSSRRLLRVFIHVTGGMSLFLFLPDGSPALTKMIPYFSAGVGMNFQFKRLVGIGLDASYFMFFEEYYPIMGIAPSIHVNFRF